MGQRVSGKIPKFIDFWAPEGKYGWVWLVIGKNVVHQCVLNFTEFIVVPRGVRKSNLRHGSKSCALFKVIHNYFSQSASVYQRNVCQKQTNIFSKLMVFIQKCIKWAWISLFLIIEIISNLNIWEKEWIWRKNLKKKNPHWGVDC